MAPGPALANTMAGAVSLIMPPESASSAVLGAPAFGIISVASSWACATPGDGGRGKTDVPTVGKAA